MASAGHHAAAGGTDPAGTDPVGSDAAGPDSVGSDSAGPEYSPPDGGCAGGACVGGVGDTDAVVNRTRPRATPLKYRSANAATTAPITVGNTSAGFAVGWLWVA